MSENRLKILDVNSTNNLTSKQTTKKSAKNQFIAIEAKFERLWLIDPLQFSPMRNCMERVRLERSWNLLCKHVNPMKKKVIDIGCGSGVFARRLRNEGASVAALDIAKNALKFFENVDADQIQLIHDVMPYTELSDHDYEIITCMEVIADIPQNEYRLFFAELSRLIKMDGILLCSSPIDIYSVGAKERLMQLASTEFDIIDQVESYHAFSLKLKRLLKYPSYCISAWRDTSIREKILSSKWGLNRILFWIYTTPLFISLWYGLEPITRPFLKLLKTNKKLLLFFEKVSRFLWNDDGVSHYIFIAKPRQLKVPPPEDIPIERPTKKQVWS